MLPNWVPWDVDGYFMVEAKGLWSSELEQHGSTYWLNTYFNPRALHTWRHTVSRIPKRIWVWSFPLNASWTEFSETRLWRQQTSRCAYFLRYRVCGVGAESLIFAQSVWRQGTNQLLSAFTKSTAQENRHEGKSPERPKYLERLKVNNPWVLLPADAQHKENYAGDKLGFRWSQGQGLDNVVPGKDFPTLILYRQETLPVFPKKPFERPKSQYFCNFHF